MKETPAPWVGVPPTVVHASAVMAVGICGVMMAGLQPFLLGGLATEGRLSASQIGQAATVELLSMGIAAGLAGAWLKPHRLPLISAMAALLLAALDYATIRANGGTLTALRAAAGMPSGILLWVTIAFIARSPTPERWSGAFLTLQTLVQCIWVAGLTAAAATPDTGFLSLTVLCIVIAACSLLLPRSFAPLPGGAEAAGLPPLRGWVALAACVLLLAGLIAVWVYVDPLSRQAGHDASVAGLAVSVSLACQVLGGLTATLLAGRIGWFPAVFGVGLALLGVLFGLGGLPGSTTFLILQGIFGFLWLFMLPFVVPMTIEADPKRRAAVLIGGAQLVGGSLGPLAAAALVSDSDARGVLVFGAVCLALALAVAAGLHITRVRRIVGNTAGQGDSTQ